MTGIEEQGTAGRRNIARRASPWSTLAAAVIKQAARDASSPGGKGDEALEWLKRCQSGFFTDPSWELARISGREGADIIEQAEARRKNRLENFQRRKAGKAG